MIVSQQLRELSYDAPMSAGTRTKLRALADEVAGLEHDLDRSIANHVADINRLLPEMEVSPCSSGAVLICKGCGEMYASPPWTLPAAAEDHAPDCKVLNNQRMRG